MTTTVACCPSLWSPAQLQSIAEASIARFKTHLENPNTRKIHVTNYASDARVAIQGFANRISRGPIDDKRDDTMDAADTKALNAILSYTQSSTDQAKDRQWVLSAINEYLKVVRRYIPKDSK